VVLVSSKHRVVRGTVADHVRLGDEVLAQVIETHF
jgi:hypothetical protein